MSDYLDKSRRHFLQQILGVTLAVSLPPLIQLPQEDLFKAVDKPSYIDETVLGHLEVFTRFSWQLYTGKFSSSIASRDLVEPVASQLRTVTKFLQGVQDKDVRKRLYDVASETARLAGLLSYDMNDYATAQRYYKLAIAAAQEIGHDALVSVALGRMSFRPVNYLPTPESLAQLRRARILARQTTSQATLGWFEAMEAEAYADAQDRDACLQALERARNAMHSLTTVEDPYYTEFGHVGLLGYTGICYVKLGDLDAAQKALQEALQLVDPSRQSYRAVLLTDLARAYVLDGEVEEACRLADQALDITIQVRSESILRRIRDVKQEMRAWNDIGSVRALQEKLLLS